MRDFLGKEWKTFAVFLLLAAGIYYFGFLPEKSRENETRPPSVVPGVSAFDLRLGMNDKEVRDLLGDAQAVDELLDGVTRWSYPDKGYELFFKNTEHQSTLIAAGVGLTKGPKPLSLPDYPRVNVNTIQSILGDPLSVAKNPEETWYHYPGLIFIERPEAENYLVVVTEVE